MSGGIIALVLVLAYLAHTYFFWKSGRKAGPNQKREKEEDHRPEENHHNTYARRTFTVRARMSPVPDFKASKVTSR